MTCLSSARTREKEVSSDARALGMRAEMNRRRCWEAQLESGSGREARAPTKLQRSKGG